VVGARGERWALELSAGSGGRHSRVLGAVGIRAKCSERWVSEPSGAQWRAPEPSGAQWMGTGSVNNNNLHCYCLNMAQITNIAWVDWWVP